MRADEPAPEFAIDSTAIWPVDDARLEPIFLAGPADDNAPGAQEKDEPAPATRQRASALSPVGSFVVHLATLLCLLGWSEAPAEIADAFPVQLVVEQSAGPAETEAETAPPAPDTETTNTAAAEAAPAAAEPTPPPAPPMKPATPAPRPPKPTPQPDPAPRQQLADTMPAADAAAATPVPADMTESDYMAHLVSLTRGHLDILPLSFLAGRHGHTLLSVVVLSDGTIGRILVKRSSGYPDIDSKIEQVVAAVGRFPPPPVSLPRPSAELDFNLTFPDALQQ